VTAPPVDIDTVSRHSPLLNCLLLLARVTSWRLGLGVALMAASGIAEGASLLLLLPLLQLVGLDVTSNTPSRLAQLSALVLTALGVPRALGAVLLVYGITAGLAALVARWQATANVRVQVDFTTYLRLRLYQSITRTRWPFFARSRPSEFAHALTLETNLIGEMTGQLLFLLGNVLIAGIYVLLSLELSPSLTAVVLVCGGALFLASKRQGAAIQALAEQMLTGTRAVFAAMTDHLHGLKTAKSYDAVDRNVAIVTKLSGTLSELAMRAARINARAGTSFQIGWIVLLSAIVYLSVRVIAVPPTELLLLLFVFARLMPRFSVIQQSYQKCAGLGPAFAHIVEVATRCRAMAEPRVHRHEPIALRSAIRLERVTFRHAADEPPTLSDVNLVLRRGETTAIVGPSGAGKSTLADLVVGLLTPQQGRVLVDGTPLRPEHLRAWRAQIGLVAQDPYLLNDTVRTNLLWGCPDAEDGEIKRALAAAAAEFVFDLPDSLDTMLGERGVRLSGGERQRLVLASALLRRPGLLILDEATSAVDSENEQRIQLAIETLHGRMTILVIAHRLTTIRGADVIHVLEHGRVVESGTWDQLTAQPDGRFRALCQAQGLLDDTDQRP
jgi:ATP-binding cassette, subfamily C, bacterial